MIKEIINLIDLELEKSGKSYMSVQKANRIINESGLNSDNISNLTNQLIKDEKIPHAFKFPKSKYWSIPHSNPEKVEKTKYRRCSECRKLYPITSDLKIKAPTLFGKLNNHIVCPYCHRKTEVPYNLLDNIRIVSNNENESSSISGPSYSSIQDNIPWWADKRNNKYVYWGIFILIIIVGIISSIIEDHNNNGSTNTIYNEGQPQFIKDLNSRYVGETYDINIGELFINKYGYPETLNGTNNYIWVAYFPLGNFTMTQTKGDYKITKFEAGKKPRGID